jgi:hypothetical protein
MVLTNEGSLTYKQHFTIDLLRHALLPSIRLGEISKLLPIPDLNVVESPDNRHFLVQADLFAKLLRNGHPSTPVDLDWGILAGHPEHSLSASFPHFQSLQLFSLFCPLLLRVEGQTEVIFSHEMELLLGINGEDFAESCGQLDPTVLYGAGMSSEKELGH